MRGFKIAHGTLRGRLRAVFARIMALEKARAAASARVPVRTVTRSKVVKLAPERKHLTNLLKMVAYQAESDLVQLVAPHYQRIADEGRTLIQSILTSDADLEVTPDELRVSVAPLSSPHRTRALAALCQDLNARGVRFPGSSLCLHYRVATPGTCHRTIS